MTNFSPADAVHLDFATKGLACYAICLIEYAGILDILKNNGLFFEKDLNNYRNPPLIRAAFATLVGAKILKLNDRSFSLTELGKGLAKNIGIITLLFAGYRNLLAKQFDLLDQPKSWNDSDIDYPSIALGSINFGLSDLDPILLECYKTIKPQGMICDLGCGTGEKLTKICDAINVSGLGIERDPQVVSESKRFTKNSQHIKIIQGDITKLKGTWEDVETVMLSFVYHDINPLKKAVQFLISTQSHFPKMRFLIVIDIVSPSKSLPSIMPGFDYVHGLQGINPRNYEETVETFFKAGLKIFKEIAVPNMPNTFIWIIEKK